jgi:hypothetical protein
MWLASINKGNGDYADFAVRFQWRSRSSWLAEAASAKSAKSQFPLLGLVSRSCADSSRQVNPWSFSAFPAGDASV